MTNKPSTEEIAREICFRNGVAPNHSGIMACSQCVKIVETLDSLAAEKDAKIKALESENKELLAGQLVLSDKLSSAETQVKKMREALKPFGDYECGVCPSGYCSAHHPDRQAAKDALEEQGGVE